MAIVKEALAHKYGPPPEEVVGVMREMLEESMSARMFVWHLITSSGVFGPARQQGMTGDDLAYALGRRSVGQEIFNTLQGADMISLFRQMQDEAETRAQNAVIDSKPKSRYNVFSFMSRDGDANREQP